VRARCFRGRRSRGEHDCALKGGSGCRQTKLAKTRRVFASICFSSLSFAFLQLDTCRTLLLKPFPTPLFRRHPLPNQLQRRLAFRRGSLATAASSRLSVTSQRNPCVSIAHSSFCLSPLCSSPVAATSYSYRRRPCSSSRHFRQIRKSAARHPPRERYRRVRDIWTLPGMEARTL
jgi:hypothetical protein